MSLTSSADAGTVAPGVDQQMRLRIAQQLGATFAGDFIGPDQARYHDARAVGNAMIDRRPGRILRGTSTGDVVAAVNAARQNAPLPPITCGRPAGTRHASTARR